MSAGPDAKEKHADKAVRAPIEKKADLPIGPKFVTLSMQASTEAVKACRDRHDGDWHPV